MSVIRQDRSKKSNVNSRELALLEAVRKGKRKQIAGELSMREATVKAHIRCIIKKLNARNRAELTSLASVALAEEQGN
jgi:DNA-binding NarL/FixJ family response regulator